jgi:molybdopterin-guanine dinucleotide biosynthesis protein A
VTGPQSQIAGVVLAGGMSRRMGTDKARLAVGRQTLLERTTGVLLELFDEVIVVADRADRFTGLAGVRVVADLLPGAGPLGGIHAALNAIAAPAAFVVACDMPLLDASVVARQIVVWRDTDADALAPLLHGRPEPLHAVYATSCLPAIEDQIRRGDCRVHALFDAIRVCFWEPDPADARAFTNVNTPEDWAGLAEGEERP